jgi:hypothetical protein
MLLLLRTDILRYRCRHTDTASSIEFDCLIIPSYKNSLLNSVPRFLHFSKVTLPSSINRYLSP